MTALSQDCLLDGKFADGKGLVNIHGGRYMRCAALKQAELDRTDLLELQPILEVIRKASRKTAELSVAETVACALGYEFADEFAVFVVNTFGNDGDAFVVVSGANGFNVFDEFIYVESDFGKINKVGA